MDEGTGERRKGGKGRERKRALKGHERGNPLTLHTKEIPRRNATYDRGRQIGCIVEREPSQMKACSRNERFGLIGD